VRPEYVGDMFADRARGRDRGHERRNSARAAAALSVVALVATVAGCGSGSEATKKPLGAGQQRLTRGTQVLDLPARVHDGTVSHLPKIALTVPDGWFNYDGWALGKAPPAREGSPSLPPDAVRPVFVTFWDVASVYPTPCDWAGKPLVDPGPGVDGLASALTRQPLRNATTPTDVALGGFHSKYLRWSVPTDIAFDEKRRSKALFPRCDEKTFQSWTGSGWARDRYEQAPAQVDMLWILDVHGQRLVVDASYLPEATAADRTELDGVVHSIQFMRRDGS